MVDIDIHAEVADTYLIAYAIKYVCTFYLLDKTIDRQIIFEFTVKYHGFFEVWRYSLAYVSKSRCNMIDERSEENRSVE